MTGQKRQAGAEFTKPTYVNPFSDNNIAMEKKIPAKNQFSICKMLRNKVKVLLKRQKATQQDFVHRC